MSSEPEKVSKKIIVIGRILLTISIIALSHFLISCKQEVKTKDADLTINLSRLEKLGIDNITGHRNYQDSVTMSGKYFSKSVDQGQRLEKVIGLIGEYRNLNTQQLGNSIPYNYFLARLYNRCIELPFTVFYDTIGDVLRPERKFKERLDSAHFYSQRLIKLDPGNPIGYRFSAEANYRDLIYGRDFKGYQRSNRLTDISIANEDLNVYHQNIDRVFSNDTSRAKLNSRTVIDYLLYLTMVNSDFNNISEENRNNIALLDRFVHFHDMIRPFREQVALIDWKYEEIDDKYYPVAKQASELQSEIDKMVANEELLTAFKNNPIGKFSYVKHLEDGSINVAMIELYSGKQYTHSSSIVGGPVFSGRGTFNFGHNSIVFNRTSGTAIDGSQLFTLMDDKIICIRIHGGPTYILDNDGAYIKRLTDTPELRRTLKRPSDYPSTMSTDDGIQLIVQPSMYIGSPKRIGDLFIAEQDFPVAMSADDALKACSLLGIGWRLPTKKELNFLYENKDAIGGFRDEVYWSYTKNGEGWWAQYFMNGEDVPPGIYLYYVRAVRDFL